MGARTPTFSHGRPATGSLWRCGGWESESRPHAQSVSLGRSVSQASLRHVTTFGRALGSNILQLWNAPLVHSSVGSYSTARWADAISTVSYGAVSPQMQPSRTLAVNCLLREREFDHEAATARLRRYARAHQPSPRAQPPHLCACPVLVLCILIETSCYSILVRSYATRTARLNIKAYDGTTRPAWMAVSY